MIGHLVRVNIENGAELMLDIDKLMFGDNNLIADITDTAQIRCIGYMHGYMTERCLTAIL